MLTALDGPAALDAARAGHPDLVAPELMLPGLDGVEGQPAVAEVLRGLRHHADGEDPRDR